METCDERFYRIHCLFRPWISEINVLAAHLIENETRGDLVFIDKALGVRDLKRQLAQKSVEDLSLRRFSESLAALGYRASKSLLSIMDYAVDVLLPLIPQALRAGMGRPRIQSIRRIESACRGYWHDRNAVMAEFDALFADALSSLDGDAIDTETLQATIKSRIANLLDIPINHVRLDLDARLFQAGAALEGERFPFFRRERGGCIILFKQRIGHSSASHSFEPAFSTSCRTRRLSCSHSSAASTPCASSAMEWLVDFRRFLATRVARLLTTSSRDCLGTKA